MIYKGLDIVTAKATRQERELVPHYLLDILEPHQMFTVVDFRNRALKIIDSLTEQGKMPVIVGGTIYYIESVVYKILVEDTLDADGLLWEKSKRKRDYDSDENPSKRTNADVDLEYIGTTKNTDICPSPINESKCDLNQEFEVNKEQIKDDVDNESKFTNEEIHARLKAVDPEMASRLHPNNRRKVLSSSNSCMDISLEEKGKLNQ
ncbi:unnamed protein product, partial [Brenthis ino]